MTRFLAALALALAAAGCGEPPPPANLLLVVLDTTRADHLSCYGHGVETTPTIDRLAAEGARFADAHAQSSLTPVSAGTLLSGALPFRHGVRSLFVVGKDQLSGEVASLPELLARSGRRTAAFVGAKPMGRQYGLARGFESYHDDLSATRERFRVESPSDAPQRPADETTDLVLPWLDAHGREPFALMVHYFDAHDASFVPPREWLERHVTFPLPDPLPRAGDDARIPALAEPAARVELYDAELRFADEQLARILAKLGELGVRGRTLVAVVADHGEAFGEHGFWTHGILYEEQLRVPLVLSGPGIARGVVVEERARLVDFLPTVADLLDLPAPAEALDGRSLAPLLEGGEAEEPREVYAEVRHAREDRLGRDPEMYALRVRDWKYIHRPASGLHELYDLAADPRELRNLYAPDHPRARAMAYRLGQMGALSGELPTLEGLSEGQLEELRRLGYL
jgi:arylsulfatase